MNIFFYFKGKTKQSSIIGVLFSLIIFGFLSYQFTASKFFSKRAPITVSQSVENDHAGRIDFNEQQYIILAITNETHKIMDPTIYEIEFRYFLNDNYTLNKLHPCKYEELNETMDEKYFNDSSFNNAYCLENKTFSLEGSIDEKTEYRYVEVIVNPCNNLTMNGTCKSFDEINAFLKGKYFSVTYPTVKIDSNDYENPLKTIVNPIRVKLDPKLDKTKFIYLKSAEVMTDNGLLFTGTNIEKKTGLISLLLIFKLVIMRMDFI